ncbi:MAG: hypothetical protein ACLUD0_00350, partial [Eubacterium ramulus]
ADHRLPAEQLLPWYGSSRCGRLFYGKRYSATCLRRRKGCPEHCKGPNESCPPYVPDFMKWAESYGAHGIRVTKEEDIIPALEADKEQYRCADCHRIYDRYRGNRTSDGSGWKSDE